MQGKVVVITGGFGGLGRAAGKVARDMGATTVLIDYAPAPEGSGGIALGGVDLTNAEAANTAIKAARDAAGRIDALFNIAGGFSWSAVSDAPLDTRSTPRQRLTRARRRCRF